MELFENPIVKRVAVTLIIIICSVIAWVVAKKIINIYNKKREEGDGPDRNVTSVKLVIADIIKVFVILLIVLTILQVNGVNVTSLVAGVGVVSAVVGLALQDFFKDIIMGMHILMDDFYKVGDVITYGENIGTVCSFNLRTTKFVSLKNGNIVTICNRNIVEAEKYSNEIHFTLPMPYETNLAQASKVMEAFVKETEKAECIESCEYQGIGELSASCVSCKVKLLTAGPEFMYAARREANKAFFKVMEEAGIDIPYDQIDVHVISEKIS